MPVGEIIGEGLQIHGIGTKAEHAEIVTQMLAKVGLNPYQAGSYPHELSGGQRQRAVIARRRSGLPFPQLLVCDEPVSALDVSIQAQVVNMLRDLQQELRAELPRHDLSGSDDLFEPGPHHRVSDFRSAHFAHGDGQSGGPQTQR